MAALQKRQRDPRGVGAMAVGDRRGGGPAGFERRFFSFFYSLMISSVMITGFDRARSLVTRHEMVGAGVRSLASHIES
jgi:hypothetical protein